MKTQILTLVVAGLAATSAAATLVTTSPVSYDAIGPSIAVFTSTEQNPRTIIRIAYVDGVVSYGPGTHIYVRDYTTGMSLLGERTIYVSGSAPRYTQPRLSRDGRGVTFYASLQNTQPYPTTVFCRQLSSDPYTDSGSLQATQTPYGGAYEDQYGVHLGDSTTLFEYASVRPPTISNLTGSGFYIVWKDLLAELEGGGGGEKPDGRGKKGSGGGGTSEFPECLFLPESATPTVQSSNDGPENDSSTDFLSLVEPKTTSYSPLMIWITGSGVDDVPGSGTWTQPAINGDGSVLAYCSGSQLYRATSGYSNWSSNSTVVSHYNGNDGNNISDWPDFDASGDEIVFRTQATNLRANDNNSMMDIYLWNDGTLSLVYNDPGYYFHGNVDLPAISGDGNWISFQSTNKNFLSGSVNYGSSGGPFVYRVDLDPDNLAIMSYQSGTTYTAKAGSDSAIGNGGRTVFETWDTGLATGDDRSGIDIIYNE